MTDKKRERIARKYRRLLDMQVERKQAVYQICQEFGIHWTSLYRYCKKFGIDTRPIDNKVAAN